MNWLRIGTIAFCTLASFAVSFALKDRSETDQRNGRVPATVTVPAIPAGTGTIFALDDRRVTPLAGANPAHEYLPESDTTGLLQESLTIDALLDEINADSGDEFTPVDRERFAALLRSDPELRKAVGD